MNARTMPRSSAPQMDITALEWEIPTTAAISGAMKFLAQDAVDADDVRMFEEGPHVHMARLYCAARLGRDIEWCGTGLDCTEARRASLYGGIARAIHADLTSMAVSSCTVDSFLSALGHSPAFPDLLPMFCEQKQKVMATVQFRQISGTQAMPVPLALVNPNYVLDVEEGQPRPGVVDDFDYAMLRRYSSDAGVAAGATLDEALAQGLLSAQEQYACGNFVVKGIALRQPQYLCRVTEASLPVQVSDLLEAVRLRVGQPIYLLDIAGSGQTPTYLAYADSTDSAKRQVAAGAGFNPEHAATRALRALLQVHEHTVYASEQSTLDVRTRLHERFQWFMGEQEGQYRCFAFHNVHDLIANGTFTDVALDRRRVPLRATLAERIRTLCEAFTAEGMTPWYTQYQPRRRTSDVCCVQVILAPFDANFLLLHGVPVGLSLASLEGVAND